MKTAVFGTFASLSFVSRAGAPVPPPPTVDLGGPAVWEGRSGWAPAPWRIPPRPMPIRPSYNLPPAKGRPSIHFFKKRFAAGETIDVLVGFEPDLGQRTSNTDLSAMRLTIDSPDGKRFSRGNVTMYEGGFPEHGWTQPRAIPLALPGTYTLEYTVHEYTSGKVSLQVETLPALAKLTAGFDWMRSGDVTRKGALPVALVLQNLSHQTIRFPVRRGWDSSGGRDGIRLAVLRNEPTAESASWRSEALELRPGTVVQPARYPADPVRPAESRPSVVLKPGAYFRQELDLHDVMDRLPESVWREGPFQVELSTTLDLLIGEPGGPWADFSPVKLVVKERKDFRLVQSTLIVSKRPSSPMFSEVPRDHWAYACLSAVAGKIPIYIGTSDGTFGGKRLMTRYEFAVSIARLAPCLEELMRPPDIDGHPRGVDFPFAPGDFECLTRLAEEFRPELETLQVNFCEMNKVFARAKATPTLDAATLFKDGAGRSFDDVSAGDGAYACVALLAGKYPGTLVCDTPDAWKTRTTSRYEFAVLTARLLSSVQSNSTSGPRKLNPLEMTQVLYNVNGKLSTTPPPTTTAPPKSRLLLTGAEVDCLDRLVSDFYPELTALRQQIEGTLGVKPEDLRGAVRQWQGD